MTQDQTRELETLRKRLGMVVDPTIAERNWTRAYEANRVSPFVRRALARELPAKATVR